MKGAESLGSLKLLVIEDDEVDREKICRLLSKMWVVTEAATVAEGLELLKSVAPDCVLLDYRLPDRDGVDALPEIADQGFPVVMMTGQGSEHIAVEAMKGGAEDYLPKTEINAASLSRALGNAIEKLRLRRELEDRQEELEAFATVVSHDLRSPMGTAMMLVETIRMSHEFGDAKMHRESVDQMEKHIDSMAKLVRDLHEYTVHGREQTPLEPVELGRILQIVQQQLAGPIQEANAEIVVEDLPVIQGDPVGMGQLFTNLISNAVKYSRDDAPPKIQIGAIKSSDDKVRLFVKDNGLGIPPEVANKIFNPFFRVREHKQGRTGSGIGLALCSKIAEQHGGRIWVESEVGVGSTFWISVSAEEKVAAE